MNSRGSIQLVLLVLLGVFSSNYYVWAADEDSLPVATTKTVFGTIGEGVGNQIGSDLTNACFGWALGKMGFGGNSQLNEISDQLGEIIDDLNIMIDQLNDIDESINQLDCNTLTDQVKQAWSYIRDQEIDYYNFVQNAQLYGINPTEGTCDPSKGESECADLWADNVLGGAGTGYPGGVGGALTAIDTFLRSTRTAQGAILACETLAPLATGDWEAKSGYWNATYGYNNFWYNAQTRGLNLLVEAYHYTAWQSAGSPVGNVTDYMTICTDPCQYASNSTILNDIKTNCALAYDWTNSTYQNLIAQYEEIGAPFSDENIIVQYTNVGNGTSTATLYTRSLESFSAAAGDNCPYPLTSNAPCGVLASADIVFSGDSLYSSTFLKGGKTVFGYSQWVPANQTDFDYLIQGYAGVGSNTMYPCANPSDTYGCYMESEGGFQNFVNKIFFLQAQTNIKVGTLSGQLKIFLDTDYQYIYDQKGVNNYMIEQKGKSCGLNDYQNQGDLLNFPRGDPSFYLATIESSCSHGASYQYWANEPGWWYASSQEQFSLPKIDLNELGCGFNGGGRAFAACPNVFSERMDVLIPTPPAPVIPTCTIPQSRRLRGSMMQ